MAVAGVSARSVHPVGIEGPGTGAHICQGPVIDIWYISQAGIYQKVHLGVDIAQTYSPGCWQHSDLGGLFN